VPVSTGTASTVLFRKRSQSNTHLVIHTILTLTTMENRNPNHLSPPLVDRFISDDLEKVEVWTKNVLFRSVKFLMDPKKDLQTGKSIFRYFEKTCGPTLKGVLCAPPDVNERLYKDMYIERVWSTANGKNKNVVSGALSMKRSSVVATMANRFYGT
jgi:hypothetical protein